MLVLTASWAAVCWIVYRLADRWLEAAQLLFLAALSGTIMVAALWLEQPVLLAPAIMIPVIDGRRNSCRLRAGAACLPVPTLPCSLDCLDRHQVAAHNSGAINHETTA